MEDETVGVFVDLTMPGADVQSCLDVAHEVLAANRYALAPVDLAPGMVLLPGRDPIPLAGCKIILIVIAQQFGSTLSVDDAIPPASQLNINHVFQTAS